MSASSRFHLWSILFAVTAFVFLLSGNLVQATVSVTTVFVCSAAGEIIGRLDRR